MTPTLPLIISLLSFFLCFTPSVQASQEYSRLQVLMGDVPVFITIRTAAGKKEKAFETMDVAFMRAREIEEAVSEFNPHSQTSILNRSAGLTWNSVGVDLLKIILLAKKMSQLTEGAFDITFPSINPDITSDDILISHRTSEVFLGSGVQIKVSGIAKGYIVDEMGEEIEKAGFRKYLVNAGGDLLARGKWKVGIRSPHIKDKIVKELTLKNQAASTSGLYERGNHIIDPRTGERVSREGSVTVMATTSAWADALATAGFVLGENDLRRVLSRIPSTSSIFLGGKE